jgi:glycine oxidase
MRQPDVLIIGAGVIGCATAYYLRRDCALHVVVVERELLGAGASNAAAGLLPVASSRASGGALFDLRRRSAEMFPSLIAALAEDTPVNPEYVRRGLVELAFNAREDRLLQNLVTTRREQGFRAEMLDPKVVRDLEPAASPDTRAGALFHDDHTINNQRFTAALADAAERRGAELRLNSPVTAIETAGSRILRVRAGEGEWVSPGVVVLAAGTWSPEVAALARVRVPVRPARGEMIALRPVTAAPHHTLVWGDGYLVPRPGGEVLVGSTSTYADTADVTGGGLRTLVQRALRMMPALSDAALVRAWAGLRPCSTIRRPIIGPVKGFDNFLIATGHHRSGILLAPITGQLIAQLITQRATSVSLRPFGYRPR